MMILWLEAPWRGSWVAAALACVRADQAAKGSCAATGPKKKGELTIKKMDPIHQSTAGYDPKLGVSITIPYLREADADTVYCGT